MDTRTTPDLERRLFGRPLPDLYRRIAERRGLRMLPPLVEERVADWDFRLPDAARQCRLDPDTLNQHLQTVSGFTFHRFLRRRRLLRSVSLMEASGGTLLGIALDSGFGSLSAYERNFQLVFGEPPREFRARLEQGRGLEPGSFERVTFTRVLLEP